MDVPGCCGHRKSGHKNHKCCAKSEGICRSRLKPEQHESAENLGTESRQHFMKNADRARKFWREHPEYRKKVRERQRAKEYAFRRWLHEYLKQHGCVDCGESDPLVLEFDHVVCDVANRDVGSMGQNSEEKILEEIKKCEVVCANCHTRRTAKRANTLRWQLSQEGN